MTTKTKSLYDKLFTIVKKIGTVATTQGGMAYAVVTHNNVSKKVLQVFETQNIIGIPDYSEYERIGDITKVKCTYTVVNLDDPKDTIVVSAYGEGIDKQDKGAGKAQSYALKYCQMKLFSMATGKEDESDLYDPDDYITTMEATQTIEQLDAWIIEKWEIIETVFNDPVQMQIKAAGEIHRKKLNGGKANG